MKPDARVGICVERGLEMVVGLLGVLKAGGAYVPLDPAYPEERLRWMLEDSAPVALLTQGHLEGLFTGLSEALPVVDLSAPVGVWSSESDTNLECAAIGLTSEHLAYIIYTSGSTGTPKGVMVMHQNAVNLIQWGRLASCRDALQRTLFSTSLSFDLSAYEFFVPISAGITIRLVRNLLDLVRIADDITLINTVPSAMNALLESDGVPTTVHVINLAGEALQRRLVERIFATANIEKVCNLYGPSETTTYSTSMEVRRGDIFVSSIGRPIANTRIYILDSAREPVPIGVAGELYIGGAGVARGYLNQPALTAERFVRDPFVEEAGARMYKTGDLGKWLGDGTIEFLGRNDFQVKIRGFRIELGEIEEGLRKQEGIREAVVIAREDEPGEKRLVAYYTCGEGEGSVSVEELRAQLGATLPEYMVPAAYVRLERMPLTVNGKLDRKALPEPEGEAYGIREYEAPQGEIEEKLAAIWAEVLKVERVGRHDNFFELGGHSLLAVRVLTRVRKMLSVQVALEDLFARPVLVDFVRGVERAVRKELPTITRVERSRQLPLSFAQQRLWFLGQMEGVSKAYHIPFGLRLQGELNRSCLCRALDRILARHEALRTTFELVNGEAVQRIASVEGSHFNLIEHDLRECKEAEAELDRLMLGEFEEPFDLEGGPLIRGRLIREGEDEYTLLITMHHIVSDGWSMGVFLNELSALYRAFVKGEEDPLAELEVQYADYAVWQREWVEGEVLREQAEYWKEALAGVPEVLELPADHARPGQQDYAGEFVGLGLGKELTAGLKELSRRHGTTLHMTLLAGWAALLSRLSGQQDIVIGTPVANRSRVEIENLIGFFVNTLALRVEVGGSVKVRELLAQVRAKAIEAQQHQDIPFEQVVELARPVRSLAHSPVFQVMFAWQNAAEGRLVLPGLEVKPPQAFSYRVSKFDLTLTLQESGEGIVGGLEYATSLFERNTIERYVGYLRRLLEGMVAEDGQVVDRIPILSEEEREQVVYKWNETEVEYPREKCVQELFEEQVERTPEGTAVVFEGSSLSYRELNRRANQVAHYLRRLGVKPDARVGIVLERSVELIVAELAVLKCGAAYVPIDPAFPAERKNFIIRDCEAKIVLSIEEMEVPEMCDIRKIDVGESTDCKEASNVDVAVNSEAAAYIMYTSGSSGEPKGVIVPHRAITRLVLNNGYAEFKASDRVAFAANPAFDAATLEVWAPLLNGGCAVVIAQDVVLDPARFKETLKRQAVDVLWLTVGLFNQYANELGEEIVGLRYLIIGGDRLDPQVVSQVLRRNAPKHLLNGYGPTETTTFATTHEITFVAENATSIPIGRPIANTRIYILDSAREPVPVGVAGELYIGGAGVARGYLNQPALTAERFVRNPFVEEAGAQMYKTGDLGRWLGDGTIEFLGRNDFQVKIRGFRIELGEIEEGLRKQKGIREAVVIAREDEPGEKRLVAYYTCGEGEGSVSVEELRAQLGATLPEYMVPAAYVRLERMPLTVNGKLDRKALPEPEGEAYGIREYEAPQGEIEEKLAAIWAEVLKVERVGRHDNFFELGGHSLLAVSLVERMRQQGQQVNVRALFSTPTVAGLLAAGGDEEIVEVPANRILPDGGEITPEMLPLVELSEEEVERVVRSVPGGARNVQDIYPLAPLQEGILFHHLMDGESDPYLLAIVKGFDSRMRLDRYVAALQAVIDRHDILRTAVVWEGLRQPVQVVWRKAALSVEEVKLEPGAGEAEKQLYERFDPRHNRMDIRQAPLLRVYIAEDVEKGRWLLLELLHHLAGDHTTLEVMQEEMQEHLLGRGGGARCTDTVPKFCGASAVGGERRGARRVFPEDVRRSGRADGAVWVVECAGRWDGDRGRTFGTGCGAGEAIAGTGASAGSECSERVPFGVGASISEGIGARRCGVRDGIVRTDAGWSGSRSGDGVVHQHATDTDRDRRRGSRGECAADAHSAGRLAETRTRIAGTGAEMQRSSSADAVIFGVVELSAQWRRGATFGGGATGMGGGGVVAWRGTDELSVRAFSR